jgi:hypothetical protein
MCLRTCSMVSGVAMAVKPMSPGDSSSVCLMLSLTGTRRGSSMAFFRMLLKHTVAPAKHE